MKPMKSSTRSQRKSQNRQASRGGVIRRQVVEPAKHALRRRVSPEQATSQSALARNTDGGMDTNSLTPPPCWTGPGRLLVAAKNSWLASRLTGETWLSVPASSVADWWLLSAVSETPYAVAVDHATIAQSMSA